MIERPRERDGNRYWDDPVNGVKAADAEFHFRDYFDWDEMAYIDFQYYRVRIAAFPLQPHLVGREALLEHQYAKVFVDHPGQLTDDQQSEYWGGQAGAERGSACETDPRTKKGRHEACPYD